MRRPADSVLAQTFVDSRSVLAGDGLMGARPEVVNSLADLQNRVSTNAREHVAQSSALGRVLEMELRLLRGAMAGASGKDTN